MISFIDSGSNEILEIRILFILCVTDFTLKKSESFIPRYTLAGKIKVATIKRYFILILLSAV